MTIKNMNKNIRYINWFNKQKKICLKNNKNILRYECPYEFTNKIITNEYPNEFNVRLTINQILVNYNNYKYSYCVKPKIINNNDVKKLNGAISWFNQNIKNNKYKSYDVSLINPNLDKFVNKFDFSQVNTESNFEFHKINLKYFYSIQKINYTMPKNMFWKSFIVSPKYYNIDNILELQETMNIVNVNLIFYGFNFPYENNSNKIKFNREYHVHWTTIINEKNIHKLIQYILEFNKIANKKDKLIINIHNISEKIVFQFNLQLRQIPKLNYTCSINIPHSLLTKYLDDYYLNSCLLADIDRQI